ncbi:beta-galactosidase [Kribbella jiaozuonensis]|uniref:Glycosyl hydrolase n=1 Tax=Kribbella jiaozuonensis TaxID=2575441 RepID=A0A4U3LV92_9ACTN|nr:beta-galactosidase [Kribbella jiaozuonensis]TKK80035.1 glycosyl hydrolase [Kribbella jiaozuonensis]
MTARSIRLERRRLLVDGVPRILMAGEVHYFRLHREDWADRLDKLVAAGCDAVASYMPWLVHETADGFDLTGESSEYRDLVGFLELAAERDLLVIARPGPFVMAELKNEGLPFRIYREHPDAVPLGWDGKPASSATLDYLSPGYLGEAERWYGAIMPVLAERLVSNGGPIAAVQLDNEVGMLSWVTNTPELTDRTLADLAVWAFQTWGREGSISRYGADPDDPAGWASQWRAGGTLDGTVAQQLALHHDLGAHHRDRYARYLLRLRDVAIAHGVDDVPFLVNLHGTYAGRGRHFPIGISQLSKSYAGVPQMTSGSDHYIGELTVEKVPDLYVMNAFMAAVHDADQPITSLEFEAGTGDYGEDLSSLTSPETAELKTRLCVAQGNRLVNYYLFAGGHNPPLDTPVGDGNDRIAFTGERHGFAAPVDPEGRLSTTYAGTASAVRAVRGAEHLLAGMDEEYDDVVLGYVPDHYLTEYCHPSASVRRDQVGELERYRGMGPRDILARALLLGGYSFRAVDMSGAPTSAGAALDPAGPVVALATPPVLGRAIQERLAAFVRGGGRLLLHGRVPVADDDGTPCTVLADELGVKVDDTVQGTPHYFPSVRATAWAGPQPEVRVGMLEHLVAPDAEILAVDVATGAPVAVATGAADAAAAGAPERSAGGRVVVMACDYPCHLGFWRQVFERVGVQRQIVAEGNTPGLVVTSTADADGQRLVHLINVAPVAQTFTLTVGDVVLELGLGAREGLVLPFDVRLDDAILRWSTAELDGRGDGSTVLLRRSSAGGSARIETTREVAVDGDVTAARDEQGWLISWPAGATTDRLTVRLS